MIYRIAEQADGDRAQREGAFVGADLAAEGFIYCSGHHQVLRTVEKYYAGKTALVLTEIDDHKLGTALAREDLAGPGVFPRVYGPIPLAAIVRQFTASSPLRRLPLETGARSLEVPTTLGDEHD